MADEAVVRIVLEGNPPPLGQSSSGGGGASTPSGGGGGASQSPPFQQPPPPQQATAPQSPPSNYLTGAPLAQSSPQLDAIRAVFAASIDDLDAAALAMKSLGFAAADIARVRLEFTPSDAHLEAEAWAALNVARKNAVIDLQEEAKARKLLELEARAHLNVLRKQQEEAAKLVEVESVFSPEYEARKRREGEVRKAQIDAAYKEQYGGDAEESGMGQFLKIANALRGTMGGVFGTIVGAALDVAVGFQRMKSQADEDKKQEELLAEAKDTTSAVKGLGKPQPPAKEVKGGTGQTSPPAPKEGTAPPTAKATTATEAEAAGLPEALPAEAGAAGGAEAAAAGGGMMESLAAAAGPIGLIVAAVLAVDQAVKGAIRGMVGGVAGLAAGIASANTDPAEPLAKFGGALSSAGDKLPLIGIGAVAAGEALMGLSRVMQAIDQTAQRYGEFSPAIAQAQAVAEIRQTMGDFRRAQTVGTEMAKYVMARSDLQHQIEETKVRLLTKMLPAVTEILKWVETAVNASEGMANGIITISRPLVMLAEEMGDLVGLVRTSRTPEVADPTAMLFDRRMDTVGSSAGGGRADDRGFVPEL